VAVELGHEPAVSCAGGGELVVAFLEFQFQVGRLLFEGGDSGLELFGVIGAADAGLAPGLFAERFVGALFEAADLGGEAGPDFGFSTRAALATFVRICPGCRR